MFNKLPYNLDFITTTISLINWSIDSWLYSDLSSVFDLVDDQLLSGRKYAVMIRGVLYYFSITLNSVLQESSHSLIHFTIFVNDFLNSSNFSKSSYGSHFIWLAEDRWLGFKVAVCAILLSPLVSYKSPALAQFTSQFL